MARKRYHPEDIISKLRQADIFISQGKTVAEIVRFLEISDVTYYRWRKEYGGMNTTQAKRLKELEKENLRLRTAISVFGVRPCGTKKGHELRDTPG